MTIGTPTNAVSNAGGDVTSLTLPSAGTIDVTAGELLVVSLGRYAPVVADAIVVGDISTSGTATIGSWSLDAAYDGASNGQCSVGHFSALVTGSGTLTVTLSGFPDTCYALCGLISVPGSWDASRLEDFAGLVTDTASTSVSTGTMDSAGAALFVGVCQVNTGVSTLSDSTSATNVYKALSPDTGAVSYRISTGTLSYGFTWTTDTAADHGAAGVVYKEVAAGGATLGSANGVTLASISQFNGIAKASVASKNGLTTS